VEDQPPSQLGITNLQKAVTVYAAYPIYHASVLTGC